MKSSRELSHFLVFKQLILFQFSLVATTLISQTLLADPSSSQLSLKTPTLTLRSWREQVTKNLEQCETDSEAKMRKLFEIDLSNEKESAGLKEINETLETINNIEERCLDSSELLKLIDDLTETLSSLRKNLPSEPLITERLLKRASQIKTKTTTGIDFSSNYYFEIAKNLRQASLALKLVREPTEDPIEFLASYFKLAPLTKESDLAEVIRNRKYRR